MELSHASSGLHWVRDRKTTVLRVSHLAKSDRLGLTLTGAVQGPGEAEGALLRSPDPGCGALGIPGVIHHGFE